MAVQMAVRVVKARLRGAGKPECEAEGGGERAVKESVCRRRAGSALERDSNMGRRSLSRLRALWLFCAVAQDLAAKGLACGEI